MSTTLHSPPLGWRLVRGSAAAACCPLLAALALLSTTAATARGQSSSTAAGTSPPALLQAPASPQRYLTARNQTRALLAQQRAADAEPLAEGLVRDYPRDPENWSLLARVKRAVGKHADAASAFVRAGELGGWMSDMSADRSPGINAVVEYVAAGDRTRALAMLRRQVDEVRTSQRELFYDWPGLESLRNDPEFRAILKRPATVPTDRVAGWRADIDYVYGEVQRVNPEYRDRRLPAEVTARYEALKRDVPKLSDEAVYIGIARMLAPLDQGHVALFPPGNGRMLPLQLYAFPEGMFVVGANAGLDSLVGARVLAIGATPVEEALRRVNETQSRDGEMEHLWLGTWLLRQTYYLKGLGIIPRTDSATLRVLLRSGVTAETTVATVPVGPRPKLVPPPGVPAPLFLSDVRQRHWERAMPERDALYVQMNNVLDDPDETLWTFGQRLRTVLAAQKPHNLIIDLRHNNGGSTNLYTEFLRTVVGFSAQPGNTVFVLIGRNTYSAAANLITDLDRLANPIFVGEASSECCNLHGDAQHLTLPYSGIEGELTAYRWGLTSPWDARREMSPDIPVQLTAKAYFAGEDPVLAMVLGLIKPATP